MVISVFLTMPVESTSPSVLTDPLVALHPSAIVSIPKSSRFDRLVPSCLTSQVCRAYWDPIRYPAVPVFLLLRDAVVTRSRKYLINGDKHGTLATMMPKFASTEDHVIRGALSSRLASRRTVWIRIIWIIVMKIPSPKRPKMTIFLRSCILMSRRTGKGSAILCKECQ